MDQSHNWLASLLLDLLPNIYEQVEDLNKKIEI